MAGWVTLVLMLVRLARRGVYRLSWSVLRRLGGQLAAASLMGVLLAQAAFYLPPPVASASFLAQALWLSGFIGAGILFYALAVLALGGLRLADIRLLRGHR